MFFFKSNDEHEGFQLAERVSFSFGLDFSRQQFDWNFLCDDLLGRVLLLNCERDCYRLHSILEKVRISLRKLQKFIFNSHHRQQKPEAVPTESNSAASSAANSRDFPVKVSDCPAFSR